LPVSELERVDPIEDFKRSYGETKSTASVNRTLAILRHAINWGRGRTPPIFTTSPFHRFGVKIKTKGETKRDRRVGHDESARSRSRPATRCCRARDRAALALHSDDAVNAATLWTDLVELALRVAAAGGDRTRAALLEDFRGRPFRLAGERRHTSARRRLSEASESALTDIDDSIGGGVLLRDKRLAEVRAALDTGRYLEIRGTSGVGKSGLLKHLARQVSAESRIIVLSPVRTTPRGWSHMRAVRSMIQTVRTIRLCLISVCSGKAPSTTFFSPWEDSTLWSTSPL
jgi:hypothetical protein